MEDALEEYRINGRAWEAEDELDISKKYRAYAHFSISNSIF
jgi:hypothetical protein